MEGLTLYYLLAGMPSFSLTDIAEMRLEVISLFLVGYLLCALLLKIVWNYLAEDFTWMPPIGFRRSLAMLVVSGLFLYVVLTMISGARELMTPGAWKKTGATYKLTGADREVSLTIRRDALANLGRRLEAYAAENEGRLPERRFDPELPLQSWIAGDGSGLPFEYIGGQTLNDSEKSIDNIIAYEPPDEARDRLVLFSDGRIEALNWRTIFELTAVRRGRSEPVDE